MSMERRDLGSETMWLWIYTDATDQDTKMEIKSGFEITSDPERYLL